ncbi:pre-rRNA-processing protein TSR2 homolog [Caloenas nicobarica]|uniref:pre-rRNA-processing protein TSR2 homolog n=1 Tax=Caloenas nicobarica TaxID=187106 RepID=UPI0032B7CE4D
MAAGGLGEPGLFAQGVRAVLGGWAALQLAVAQGFGGPQSPEKAAWLAGALQEFFTQNADLEEEEVEEFLAEVMDNEFDTAVEDGSLRQVSRELLTLWARRGDTAGVGEALGALSRRGPALRAALAAAHPLDGPAHPLDGPAHHLDGPAHRLDGPAHCLDAPAHRLDGQAPPTPLDTPPHMDMPPREGDEESEEEAMECGTPPHPPAGWTLVRRRRR